MKITIDTDNIADDKLIELIERLGFRGRDDDFLDDNDEVCEFRGNLTSAAIATGRIDLNEGTGDLVLLTLEG